MSTFFMQYPASSGGSTNPSTGINGATAPTSSTEVGGVTPAGNLQPISVDTSGNQNVNVVSSVLPTGAATAANQTSEITQLTGINGKLTTTANGLKVDGSAVTQPISGSVTVSGTVTTTDAANGSVAPGTPGTKSELGGGIYNSTLPTVTSGQQVAMQVDSSGRQIIAPLTSTSSISVANFPATQAVSGTVAVSTLPSIPAGSNAIGSVSVSNFPASQAVTGTFFQATQPVSIAATLNTSDAANGPVTPGTVATKSELAGGQYNSTLPTLTTGQQVALQVDSSGRQITAPLSSATSSVTVLQPTGTNLHVVVDSGTIATTQGASAGVANAPVYNSYSTTAVSTTAYTQLIASTTSAATVVDIFDSSGQAMILATGAAGSEVILYYIQPGGNKISVSIPASTRIAIKALTASATSGYTTLNLLK